MCVPLCSTEFVAQFIEAGKLARVHDSSRYLPRMDGVLFWHADSQILLVGLELSRAFGLQRSTQPNATRQLLTSFRNYAPRRGAARTNIDRH